MADGGCGPQEHCTLSVDYARAALDACQCASGLDVFAYHTYPGGYSQNTPPESMDYGAFGPLTTRALREAIRSYPGIRSDIQFWDDEFNALPNLPRGNDESVQAKYVTRGMLYNWASGIPTYIWELINDTSSRNPVPRTTVRDNNRTVTMCHHGNCLWRSTFQIVLSAS